MIDRLIEIDTKTLRRSKNPRRFLMQVRNELAKLRDVKFDVAIDFQGLMKSALVGKLSGAKKIYGFSRNALKEPASRIFLNKTVDISAGSNIILKNLKLANRALKLGLELSVMDDLEFPIHLDAAHLQEAEDLIATGGENFAIVNPGGSWPAKLWEAERFGQLADRIWEEFGYVSFVTYGPGEEDLADTVIRASRWGKALRAPVSIKGFVALVNKAKVYIGGDTGPTHLAVAVKTPVVGIFGPTEWWRNGSPRPLDIGVKHEGIVRHECTRRPDSKCGCMDIAVDAVFAAVRDRLAKIL